MRTRKLKCQVPVYMEVTAIQELSDLAEARGKPLSAFARDILQDFLNRRRTDSEAADRSLRFVHFSTPKDASGEDPDEECYG
jgi:hypothetical protein